MDDFERQAQRLNAALARIATAAMAPAPPPPATETGTDSAPATAEVARLTTALAESEAAHAATTTDLANLRARHEAAMTTLSERIASLVGQLDAQGAELGQARALNAQLREALRALREQLAADAVDAGQINQALLAEVTALHHSQQADSAELDQIIAALDPLIADAGPQPPTEDDHAGS